MWAYVLADFVAALVFALILGLLFPYLVRR